VGEYHTWKFSCEAQAAGDTGEELPAEELDHNVATVTSNQTDCCMQKLLANQQDFWDEKPLIQMIMY